MDLAGFIESNPRKLGGTPVFVGTRIPVALLFEYLEAGERVEDFVEAYALPPGFTHRFMCELKRQSLETVATAESP